MSYYEGLSDRGQEVLSFLEKGASDEMSGAAVLRELRFQDLGYTTSVFYEDYRTVLSAQQQFDNMKYISRNNTIGKEWYVKAGTPLSTNYQTVIGMEGIDTDTGAKTTRYVTVAHDSMLTRGELEDKAMEVAFDTSPTFDIITARPVKARSSAVMW